MLIFCRHGETIYNAEGKFQGLTDSPLTNKGKQDADKLADFLQKTLQDSRITFFRSPSQRVTKTSEIIAAKLNNWEAITLIELKEICYGEWEGRDKHQLNQEVLSEREKDRFRFIHPGSWKGQPGESYERLYHRLLPFFKQWIVEAKTKNLVVLAHLGTMVCAAKYFQQLSDDESSKVRFTNDEVLKLDVDESGYRASTVQL